MATTPKTKGDIVFAATGRKPGDGTRVTRISAGKVELLTSTNPDKWSELAAVITGAPVEPPVVVPPVVTPPVVIVPPVVVPPVTPPVAGITPANFATALAAAKGGDVLLLGGGKYGALVISTAFSAIVTIAAADPANPPVLAGFNLSGAQNVTLRGITSQFPTVASTVDHQRCHQIDNAKDIVLDGCNLSGDPASVGLRLGYGISIDRSERITVRNSDISKFGRGIVCFTSTSVSLIGNDIHNIRSDGVDGFEMQGMLIDGNTIRDFDMPLGSADHPDCIQFQSSGATILSRDIIIRGNKLDVGKGTWCQSIFMRNEAVDVQGKGPAMFYQNILIENNTIKNAHLHGITVGETAGLTVRANHLHSADLDATVPENARYKAQFGPNAGIYVPTVNISPASTGVRVEGNAFTGADWFTGPLVNPVPPPSGWAVAGNGHFKAGVAIPAGVGAPA